MTQKRYAIVRVQGCNEERLKLCPNMPTCAFCLYGDTKEQLIAKITQVMFRKEIKYWRKDYLDIPYKKCLEQAKEIVEFLGVE